MSKIAFLGLGQTGAPMAARLLEAGHRVTVWDRTPERAAPLVGRGAVAAASPAEAVAGVDVAITMLATPDARSGRPRRVPDRPHRRGEAGDGGSGQLSAELQAPARGEGHASPHRGGPGCGPRPVGGLGCPGMARRVGWEGRDRPGLRRSCRHDPRREAEPSPGKPSKPVRLVSPATWSVLIFVISTPSRT